ncbi:hypothetical protein HPULCUR_009103 [Helicostylum pulchrum]|uniref:WD40 repeat-like protein n=1 Tax=Helicostylum pulchrum TaxID=562976 RepID=A0ABP9YA32_9FUNG
MSIKTIEPLVELKGHKAPVLAVEYVKNSPLGEHILASGSEDNSCLLWDLSTQTIIKEINNLSDPVHVYDLKSDAKVLTEPVQSYEFSNDEINSIDVNENNKFLATADDEGVVNVIDLSSHKLYKKSSKKHNSICMSVKFRVKKSWEVWSGGMDSKLYEWDFSRGLPTNIYDMKAKVPSAAQMFNPPFVYKVATSPDGEWIAASLGDSTIQLLSPPNKKQKKFDLKEVRLEDGHNSMVNCLSFLTDADKETILVSGAANGRVTVWNPSLETPILDMFKIDGSIGKVNNLKAYHFNDTMHIAVAGTGKTGDSGVLSIYQLQ